MHRFQRLRNISLIDLSHGVEKLFILFHSAIPSFSRCIFSFARIRNSCDFTLPSLIFKLPASSLTGSAQKYRRTNIFPAFGVQCFQKTIDRCGGFPALDLVLYTFAGWNTFFQFVQSACVSPLPRFWACPARYLLIERFLTIFPRNPARNSGFRGNRVQVCSQVSLTHSSLSSLSFKIRKEMLRQ